MEDFQDLITDAIETAESANSQPHSSTLGTIVEAALEIGGQAISAIPAPTPNVNLEMPAEMAESVAAIAESASEGLMGLMEGAGEIVGAVAEGAGKLIGGILGGL